MWYGWFGNDKRYNILKNSFFDIFHPEIEIGRPCDMGPNRVVKGHEIHDNIMPLQMVTLQWLHNSGLYREMR